MSKILVDIPYLEGGDLTTDGGLSPSVGKGKAVVVMLQGDFCGYCTKAKPAFQSLVNNGKFALATVQTDGGDGDVRAAKVLSKYNQAGGVPAFLGFGKDGKFKGMHTGDRDADSLFRFGSTL